MSDVSTNFEEIIDNDLEPVKIERLKIYPWQRKWYNKIKEILENHYCYVDNSPTGVGKTFMSLYVAIKRNLPIVVIGPATLEEDWKEYALNYGAKLISYISYHSLAGKMGKPIKHDFLLREDRVMTTESGQKYVITDYHPTDYLLNLIDEGTFFIFDEIQNAKNESTFFKAVAAFSHSIKVNIYPNCKTIAAFMSATPIVKESEVRRLLKVMGVITKERLYYIHPVTKRPIPDGFKEVVNFAKKYDLNKTLDILERNSINTPDAIINLTWMIFVKVLKPHMVGAMVAPASAFPEGALLDAKNGFYNISAHGGAHMQKAVKKLEKFISFEPNSETMNVNVFQNKGKLAELQTIMHELEKPRLEIYARLANLYLNENLKRKVIIFVSYDDSVTTLKWMLQNYNPVIMTGKTLIKKRKIIKDTFNNDLSCRLMIANFKVGGVGLSLHDKVGDAPRVILLTPNYYLINLHQAAGRIYRMGLKSLATVRMVYAKGTGLIENTILDNIARKTSTLKEGIDETAANCTLFPGDYPYYIEPNTENIIFGDIY